ncbi:acetyltransferase [Sphingomonas sp.]|uniref:N-acyl amino acid synthase FeeM domain-containing protein n=1 Tax=Sphingomonas sp. TaxID=28214 RepID=UPI000DB471FB|nr:acetyltransferase [Sphingomonas sp.]PZU08588.1 MAG: acetyltransferase [Sphingomonas sp.]
MSFGLVATNDVANDYIVAEPFAAPEEKLGIIRIPLPGRMYDGRDVSIDIATSYEHRQMACDLINRRYSWRGYGDDHQLINRPSHTTFTVSTGSDVIGTVTLAADSDRGLSADTLFRPEIDEYRNGPDACVCELTKLAFDTNAESKHLLGALFHVVFIYGIWKHKGTDLFIEVNPRHRRFYEAMLGFSRIGELRMNESVSAPSQLMWLRVADIRQKIDAYAGMGDAAGCRSLYPFFLTSLEEATACIQLGAATLEAATRSASFPLRSQGDAIRPRAEQRG